MSFLCIRRPRRSASSQAKRNLAAARIKSLQKYQETRSTRIPLRQNIRNATAQAEPQAQIEPDPSDFSQEPAFTWKDIDPPTDTFRDIGYKLPHQETLVVPVSNEKMLDSTSEVSALPGYNDVSGAVVVDWNGLPHFLSPREELERSSRLQRAVQEKMLGLTRQTEFEWEQPCHGAMLPRYTPPEERLSWDSQQR